MAPPLLEIQSRKGTLSSKGRMTLRVFDDRVEVDLRQGSQSHVVRYEHLAQISTVMNMRTVDLVFETTGGTSVIVEGLHPREAGHAKTMIDKMLGARKNQPAESPPSPLPNGSPAQRLRDLKALHEDGLITDAEFEAKRDELLAQM